MQVLDFRNKASEDKPKPDRTEDAERMRSGSAQRRNYHHKYQKQP